MTLVEDAAWVAQAGSWVLAGTHPGSSRVDSLLPDTFEDYARIFHPARRQAEDRDLASARRESAAGPSFYAKVQDALWREVRWREIAEANGKVPHPAMQWPSITASHNVDTETQPGLWERAPQPDSLPLRLARVLCEILAQFTRTQERCWCAVWEGYGYMVGFRSDSTLPRLAMWNRPMILACGPLSAVSEMSFADALVRSPERSWDCVESYRSPSLWWPNDRAWCVATDVDMRETYLGASHACVDRLLADERVEIMRVTADQDITWRSDVINGSRPQ